MTKRHIGRPPKVTYLTLLKIARYIQNNYTVSDACRYARISRDTYYRYYNTEPVFTEMIIKAHKGQSEIPVHFENLVF